MSSKKQKDQSLLINTRNSLEKKVKIKLEKLYETIKKHDIDSVSYTHLTLPTKRGGGCWGWGGGDNG